MPLKAFRTAVIVFAAAGMFGVVAFVSAQTSDTAPPSTPGGVTATYAAPSRVTVTWEASTDDTGVAGYYVYRNGGVIANTASLSFLDNVAPGSYSYTVAAYDAAGNTSSQSGATSFINVVLDTTPPTTPTGLTATIQSSTVLLSWNPSTDNVGVAGYNVVRDGMKLNTDAVISGGSFRDGTNLISDYTYTYSVTAYDASGNSSAPAVLRLFFDITPPSIPEGLHATDIGADHVTIAWQEARDDNRIAGYHVSRNGTALADVQALTYTDTNLATSTPYTYTVTSFDPAGNISGETALTVTTLAAPPPAPMSVLPPGGSNATPTSTASTTAISTVKFFFTLALKPGMQNGEVKKLQLLLTQKGYLASGSATGFFGSLTQKALQAFQCAQKLICSGGPISTGWGAVGPKTRQALNAGN